MRRLTLLASLALAGFPGALLATPVQWSGNGHFYEVVSVPGGISWTQASAAAVARGGYLATPTSAAENAFVFGLADAPLYWNQEPGGSDLGPWLGGYQTSDNGSTPNANWTWVTGEPWVFTNWFAGEPNNFTGAAENYLSFKCYGSPNCRSSGWNDLPHQISQFGTAVVAYVVEYDGSPAAVDGDALVDRHRLQGAPNPFRDESVVSFELARPSLVRLAVADAQGRQLRVLVRAQLPAGSHRATWDGRDAAGRRVRSGVYFAHLDVDGSRRALRLVVAH
jgi:hypothetical protein